MNCSIKDEKKLKSLRTCGCGGFSAPLPQLQPFGLFPNQGKPRSSIMTYELGVEAHVIISSPLNRLVSRATALFSGITDNRTAHDVTIPLPRRVAFFLSFKPRVCIVLCICAYICSSVLHKSPKHGSGNRRRPPSFRVWKKRVNWIALSASSTDILPPFCFALLLLLPLRPLFGWTFSPNEPSVFFADFCKNLFKLLFPTDCYFKKCLSEAHPSASRTAPVWVKNAFSSTAWEHRDKLASL